MRAKCLHAFASVTGLDDLVPRRPQEQRDLLPDGRGVVHYKYGLSAHDVAPWCLAKGKRPISNYHTINGEPKGISSGMGDWWTS
jgi:hypothetical protein